MSVGSTADVEQETVTVRVKPPFFPFATFANLLPPFCFGANRRTLIKHSTFFRQQLTAKQEGSNRNYVDTPRCVTPAAFMILHGYMETGALNMSPANEAEIFKAAKALNIELNSQTKASADAKTTTMERASCDGPVVFERIVNKHYHLPCAYDDTVKQQQSHIRKRDTRCVEKRTTERLTPPDSVRCMADCRRNVAEQRRSSSGSSMRSYPCRTCGSKFPSYYFVHKHRQYCQRQSVTLSSTIIRKTANACGDLK